jgi:hypothetical protein
MKQALKKLSTELRAHFKLWTTYFNFVFIGLTMWGVIARVRGKGEVEFFGISLSIETLYWIQGIMVVLSVIYWLGYWRKHRHAVKAKSSELK